jgi:hypothetical protein
LFQAYSPLDEIAFQVGTSGGGFSDGKVSGLSHPSPSSPILVSPYQSLQAASLRPQNAREALESIANAAWDQERSILHHLQTSFHRTKMTCLDSLAKGFVSGAVSNPDSCISSFGTCLSISSSPLNSD